MDRCEAGVEEDGACRARKRGTGGVGSERREGGRGCEAKVDAKHSLKDLPSTILNTGTFISPSFHPSLPFEFPCCPPPFPFLPPHLAPHSVAGEAMATDRQLRITRVVRGMT